MTHTSGGYGIQMRKIIRCVRRHPWITVAVPTVLSSLAIALIEYFLTGGVSGWKPVIAGLVGGTIGGSVAAVLTFIITSDDDSSVGEAESLQLLDEKRIYSRRTPAELVDEVKGRTDIAAEHISKPYLGQWLQVEGLVDDVRDRYKVIRVYLPRGEIGSSEPSFFLDFDADVWRDIFATLHKGDRISAAGKIKHIAPSGYISLEECELIDE